MGFKEKWNELVWSFRTEDRYADYESYNHHKRTSGLTSNSTSESRADGIQLNDASSFDEDEDGGHSNGISHSTEGVSETILAWRHIETWTSENHTDLNASLSDPCTRMDISKAEEDLNLSFPPPVRASLRIHDGQEDLDSLTGSGGLFFGLQLMSLDDIVAKTQAWRLIAKKVQLDNENRKNNRLLSSAGGSSSESHRMDSKVSLVETKPGYDKVDGHPQVDPDLEKKLSTSHRLMKQHHHAKPPKAPRQQSCPPGAVQLVYSHPSWIPLITDNAGNHIGVDLAPGPKGVWGQVILFGREFDTKFVLAPHWGDFLLNFVKDLEMGNFWIFNEEDILAGEGELVFFDRKLRKEIPYLQVLTSRAIAHFRSQQKDLPPHPARGMRKTHVSHIVPGQSDRIISTDITNNKLIEEDDDLLGDDMSRTQETIAKDKVESLGEIKVEKRQDKIHELEKKVNKEDQDTSRSKENNDEEGSKQESKKEEAKLSTADDDNNKDGKNLAQDFKEVAI